MRRLHHIAAAFSAGALLVSLSGTWYSFALPTGVLISLSGLSASATASTMLGAVFAAYGAALVIRGIARRALGALQAVLAIGVLVSWWVMLQAPQLAIRAELTGLTGLAGDQAFVGVTTQGPSGFFILGVLGAIAAGFSGISGVLASDKPATASRFQRNQGGAEGDPVATWDDLSEGHDPTER
jgi:uncharacterized membrane protein (TIGR02234 family)